MLTVGIEGDDALGTLHQRVIDPGLQRGALAEVEGMGDDRGASRARVVGGRVARTIIDHNDRVTRAPDLEHDAGNYRPFVVGRDDHKDVRSRDRIHRFHRVMRQP